MIITYWCIFIAQIFTDEGVNKLVLFGFKLKCRVDWRLCTHTHTHTHQCLTQFFKPPVMSRVYSISEQFAPYRITATSSILEIAANRGWQFKKWQIGQSEGKHSCHRLGWWVIPASLCTVPLLWLAESWWSRLSDIHVQLYGVSSDVQ